jgi:triosephosphate isomerase (TIM)
MFQYPCLIVNFKNYASTIGEAGLKLAKLIEKKSKQHGVHVVLAVNPLGLERIAKSISLPVLSQHVDYDSIGAHTGSILPESISFAHGVGSLVNHSEMQVSKDDLHLYINACKRSFIDSLICVETLEHALEVQACNPSAICYEPSELIGGDVSVAHGKEDLVRQIGEQISLPLFIGAGVKSREDVLKSLSLGAEGVLVASAVCCAVDPGEALDELLLGFKEFNN